MFVALCTGCTQCWCGAWCVTRMDGSLAASEVRREARGPSRYEFGIESLVQCTKYRYRHRYRYRCRYRYPDYVVSRISISLVMGISVHAMVQQSPETETATTPY